MPLGHSPSPQSQAALWGACSFLAEPALWGRVVEGDTSELRIYSCSTRLVWGSGRGTHS